VRRGMDAAAVIRIQVIDNWYGVLAALILIVGFSRAIFAKGWEFYEHNAFFWAKIGTFVVIALLSIPPTLAFLKWRRESASPTDAAVSKVRPFLWIQVALFPLDWMGYNLSDPLDQARTGRVLPERDRSSHLVIVGGISHKNSSKVVCVERHQMVCALASDRSNQAFCKSVLPGRAVRSRLVPDPLGAHPSLEGVAKSSVIITHEIFGDVRISASSEARDRKSPVTTQQISLSMSPMRQSIA
jgi:putative membrane protein